MTLCVGGGSRLGEQFEEDADRMLCTSPLLEPGRRLSSSRPSSVSPGAGSHLRPPSLFRLSASTQWALMWPKRVLGTASEQQSKIPLSWRASQSPGSPGEIARRAEAGEGTPCPQGPTGPFTAKMRGQDVREARLRSAQEGGRHSGSCVFVSFLPVRFLELQKVHGIQRCVSSGSESTQIP